MSAKKKTDNLFFIYNFIFFLGLNYLVNFVVDYVAKQNLLMPNPVFRFTFVHNTGAAFSILNSRVSLLISISVVALLYIVYKVYFSKRKMTKFGLVGISMLAAGVTHNLIERIYLGYVRDYIDLKFVNFAVFNMADVLITVGAAILIYLILVRKL